MGSELEPDYGPQEQAVLLAIAQVANWLRESGEFADVLTGQQMRRLAVGAIEVALPVLKVAVVVDMADQMMTKYPEIGKAMAEQAAAFMDSEVNRT